MSKEENILINPKDLKKKKKNQKEEVKEEEEKKEKYRAKGNLVEINLESKGRFSAPEAVLFEDYNVDDVQELAVSEIEDLLETLVVIMNKLKNDDTEVSIADFTLAEFLECLIGMKVKFDTNMIKHPWICKCQSVLPEDEQKINEDMIDLGQVKFLSIEEADDKFKNRFKEIFDSMTDEQFQAFLKERYANNPLENFELWTREDEIEGVQIKEPVKYKSFKSGDIYSFELMRVKHLVDAKKDIDSKYRHLLSNVHNKGNASNKPMADFKADKKEELNKIKRKKAKELITYAESLTLIGINDDVLKSNSEKYNHYKKLKRDEYFELSDFLKEIEYGVYYEKELSCPHCGETEGRLLQQELNPIELLPIDVDSKSKGDKREHGRANIYFGI